MILENIESPTPNNLYPNFDQNSHNWESELDIESDIEESVKRVTSFRMYQLNTFSSLFGTSSTTGTPK